METISKISLASWALFLVFVIPVLPVAPLRIYWVWAVLGFIACALLIKGIRDGKRLRVINGSSALVYLTTFVLYWVAISSVTYAETPSSAVVPTRLENILYVIIGNFQQGQIWNGLRSAYIQIVMPCIQLLTLGGIFIFGKRPGNRSVAS